MQQLTDLPTAKLTLIKGQSMESVRDLETLKEFHRVLRRTLRPPVYSVFCAIEDHAGTNPPPGIPPFTCFASETTLANEASVSRETVIRAIKELATLHLISIENREGLTKLLWPLVTNQGYRNFMEEQAKRDLLKSATCITEPQGVCQKATGGVSESHTNETNIKKPNNEKINTEPNGSGPTTIDMPDVVGIEQPQTPIKSKSKVRSHIPPTDKPKREKKVKQVSPYTKDPRLLKWRDIAKENDYEYWPNRELQKMVYDHIPPDQLDRWDFTIRDWLKHAHKIHNVAGMVKVFWFGWDAFYSGKADRMNLPIVKQLPEGVIADGLAK